MSVEMIQSCILRCQLPRPGQVYVTLISVVTMQRYNNVLMVMNNASLCLQWLQLLFFPKQKFKSRDPRRAYAIDHQEPRLRFALCSGCHFDPVVLLVTRHSVRPYLIL